MNLILLLVIGFLVFIGTYMILSINLIRIVIGISIYTHAGNLIIMSMGTYGSSRSEPLITGGNQLFVDPLLQAIVLTAIVIGFGMTAFLLVLVYRTYKVTKEDEIEGLRGKMMLSNLLILPMLLPFLCALILVFLKIMIVFLNIYT
ncbi:Na(+) H(+) antiporter subunit C [Staphylococcus aureus]|nr:Na(+) H(+) antiporter subunit C [Staphylococcus aureus]